MFSHLDGKENKKLKFALTFLESARVTVDVDSLQEVGNEMDAFSGKSSPK